MPIYEYRCDSCGCEKEYLQKVSDAPMKTCPECGRDTLTKLVSAAGFQLKGSGWYVNDYGKGNSKELKPKADGGESKGEKSNGSSPAAESSGKSEKSEKSSKSESSSTTASTFERTGR